MAPVQKQECFRCLKCGRGFHSRHHFVAHLLLHKKTKAHKNHSCEYCILTFRSTKQLEIHVNRFHNCNYCNYSSDVVDLMKHKSAHIKGILPPLLHGSGYKPLNAFPFSEITAFKGYFKTYRYRVTADEEEEEKIISVRDFFNRFKLKIRDILFDSMSEPKSVKTQISLLCKFVRQSPGEDLDEPDDVDQLMSETTEAYFNSNLKVLLAPFHFSKVLRGIVNELDLFVEFFEKNGSGWVLDSVRGCDIRIAKFEIFKAGCFTEIPKAFRNKGAIVNPKNVGSDCFKYAFLVCMHGSSTHNKNKGRTSQYEKFEHLYDFSSLKYPTSLKDIVKFEKLNQHHNIAINVFGVSDSDDNCGAGCGTELYVLLLSPHNNQPTHKIVNLLFVQDSPKYHGHYMSIMHFSRLINKQNNHKKHVCFNCLNVFGSKGLLSSHQELCFEFKAQNVFVPSLLPDGSPPVCTFEFQKLQNKLKANYVVYADFEALLFKGDINLHKQTEDENKITKDKKSGKKTKTPKNTTVMNSHVPCGFAFVVVSYDFKIVRKCLYRGMDCMNVFWDELDKVSSAFSIKNQLKVPMKQLTVSETETYKSATKCHICELTILDENEKVRDHDHNTGLFRAAAHRQCNLAYSQKQRIPVVMHNFKSYDCHLLLSSAKRIGADWNQIIPQNTEKFLSIICPNFYFVDSFMHLSTSLNTLVTNLHSKNADFSDKFGLLVQHFGQDLAEKLARKGVYPYEYMDGWNKFDEKSFPDRSEFYSVLQGELVSQEDYDFGKKIFDDHCADLGSYHDLYLMTDVLLLASVFENYRNVFISNFKLDPCYYFSLPGYSWDAALFHTQVVLDLLTDQDMYNVIELGLRGGVAMISKRFAEAFNKYMDDYVQGKQEDSFLFYIDKTNLYGEALLQYLPVSDFAWEDDSFVKQISEQDIQSWRDEDPVGRILTVDLEYPENLHLKSEHNEYPLAPEKICVTESQLSQHQRTLLKDFNMKYSQTQKKLVPHLGGRTNYTVHYRNLKFYLEHGLVLKKVHRVIRFQQRPWLRNFVLHCSELRKNATDKFEKDLFKLVVNSIFGKSMEQVRNRQRASIVSTLEKAKWFTCHANFKKFEILDSNSDSGPVIVYMNMPSIILDKPIYTAFTVLEVSKMFMYMWHYDKIKKWYGNKAQFLFTDTDSLAYHIKTEDLYEDLKNHEDEFDFSEFDKSHKRYSTQNRKVIGKMRDESDGKTLYSFVGVSPKMYSFAGKNIHKVAMKGVKKKLVKKQVTHPMFMNVLHNQKKYMCRMNLIRSKKQKLTTNHTLRVAMHSFDSKRFIMPDGISTLALNHFLIPILNGS